MTAVDPASLGALASVFPWLADTVLGGAKKAIGWSWDHAQWIAAQDRYDAKIIKQYGQIRIFGQDEPKTLRDIFTDVYVLETPTAFRRFDPEKLTEHIWEQRRDVPFRAGHRRPAVEFLAEHDKLFVLGKPGAGKTTLMKWLAVREAQRVSDQQLLGKLPIYVPLREYDQSGKSLSDYIVSLFDVCRFPADAAPFVDRLLAEGKALVLFDGLDEVGKGTVTNKDRRGQVAEELNRFARRHDKCHIVITCRIAANQYVFDPCFKYMEVADFTPDQVVTFVQNWFWDHDDEDAGIRQAKQMLSEWELPEHEGIRDLGRNPLLLTLLCLNYAETLCFPARRVEIYEEALVALLKKWDSSRLIRRHSLYGKLSLGRKQQMLAKIAFDGFGRGQVLFAQGDLVAQIEEYLAHVPEMPEKVDIDGEAVLQEIIAQHGVFVEQAHGRFSFAHLTFQEYYTAKYVEGNSTREVMEAVAGHATDAKWREVLLLAASLLQDATPLLHCMEIRLRMFAQMRAEMCARLSMMAREIASSPIAYREAAARAFLLGEWRRTRVVSQVAVHVLATRIAIDLDRSLGVDLALRSACAAAIEFCMALAEGGDFDRAYRMIRDMDFGFSLLSDEFFDVDLVFYHDSLEELIAKTQKQIVTVCRQCGYMQLAERASGLQIPAADDAVGAMTFWTELRDTLQEHHAITNVCTFLDFITGLCHEMQPVDSLTSNARGAIDQFIEGTIVLHECLQVAYVPDRAGFEDRLFMVPS